MNNETFIDSHTLKSDFEDGVCGRCVNTCSDYDNYYYNHSKCLIRQENLERREK